ncbi:uncharacterized protein LOC122069946 isoform X2 [Macadamia integrifolia]|uniref:uncharacterized protein LOC122069946 isoform X2 n=1 Tax=Macadamia integrifolia TaxID=60698 RepID=UPI001C5012AA|nr:uncharacterized protein LOC122069946 isoform X2 [Macadamia integrifolia]
MALTMQDVLRLCLAFFTLVLSTHAVLEDRGNEGLGMVKQLRILNKFHVRKTSQEVAGVFDCPDNCPQPAYDYSISKMTKSSNAGRTGISEEEDLELERQLRVLNKPPTKTFITKEGDILDCVNIYKQPAFDHPLLKNHKIQLKPSYFPRRDAKETSSGAKQLHIKLKGKKCPLGTVLIRRTSKEDLIRAKSFSRKFSTSFAPPTPSFPGQHRVSIKIDHSNPLRGVSANINIYNPPVKGGQFSTAQLWVQNGPYDYLNNIQAGWMVNPDLYQDNRTRLFTFWTNDGYHKKGCFNTLCEGFIQLARDIEPSSILSPVSVYGGQQYVIKVSLHQDNITGNWFLSVTDENKVVGYWPGGIFPNLGKGASSVVWGALAKASADGISPPMGSGHFPFDDYNHSSFFKNMKYVDPFYEETDPGWPGQKEFRDNTKCYDIKNDKYLKGGWGNTFRFGGPGGNCG